MSASRTSAAIGETVNFVVTAQGDGLAAISMSYGDNNFEQFVTGGARTARVTFAHAFTAAGTYDVRATVTDVASVEKSTIVQLHVQ